MVFIVFGSQGLENQNLKQNPVVTYIALQDLWISSLSGFIQEISNEDIIVAIVVLSLIPIDGKNSPFYEMVEQKKVKVKVLRNIVLST